VAAGRKRSQEFDHMTMAQRSFEIYEKSLIEQLEMSYLLEEGNL